MSDAVEQEISIQGMDCHGCAAKIQRKLHAEGLDSAQVDFIGSRLTFTPASEADVSRALSVVRGLGYEAQLLTSESSSASHQGVEGMDSRWGSFLLCAVLTTPLLLHMFVDIHVLHNQWLQLSLTTPVFFIGIVTFGKSALKSIKALSPNMNVLIMGGASAAYFYSILQMLLQPTSKEYYFETAAAIITFVLLGSLLERGALRKTSLLLEGLSSLLPSTAKRLLRQGDTTAYEVVEVRTLEQGDTILVVTGERIPVDCQIVEGEVQVDESAFTGESEPQIKGQGASVIGGSEVLEGSFVGKVTALGKDTVIGKIIALLHDTERNKPQIQRIGDRVSAYFVPAVLLIAGVTFLGSFAAGITAQEAMMRSIAVLVISCPCAMGLATPTAVMVGVGKLARAGVITKGGQALESLAEAETFIFDKTGTLTLGNLTVTQVSYEESDESNLLRQWVRTLAHHSRHPVSAALLRWAGEGPVFPIQGVRERAGEGVYYEEKKVFLGNPKNEPLSTPFRAALLFDGKVKVRFAFQDELRPGAKELISSLKAEGKKVVLLSGDTQSRCEETARDLGITEVFSEQLPHQKLAFVQQRSAKEKVAYIGDGINDAPALQAAQVGISFAQGTDLARHTSQLILLGKSFTELQLAYQGAKLTYRTIIQNLGWALGYNVIAIPVAALGGISPLLGALSMAFSDVIVLGNSLLLSRKRFK